MPKRFKDLKEGECFRLVENPILYYGEPVTLVKIPVLRNYFRTTGYVRNARLKEAHRVPLQKYYHIKDDALVEVVED
ncbi:MAG: hypothetical protein GXO78_04600 [Calditrichaeota bacterium]|nr:hypothetical protein [Calditrichota bacterium]